MVIDMTDIKDQGYDLGDENLVDVAKRVLERGAFLLTVWDELANAEFPAKGSRLTTNDGLYVNLRQGLCTNLRYEFKRDTQSLYASDEYCNLLALAYPQWDGYSGNETYPVDGYYEYEGSDEDSGEKVQGMYHDPNLFRNPKRKELLEWLVTSFLPEYIKHWSAE